MFQQKKLFLIVSAISISAVIAIGAWAYTKYYKDPVLARIGAYEIRRSDTVLRDKINQIYYPHDSSRNGLADLKQYFTLAEILKKNALPVTDEQLQNAAKNLEAHNSDPVNFEKVKDVFKDLPAQYLRLYVLPIYAQDKARYQIFEQDQTLQQKSLAVVAADMQEFNQSKPSRVSDWAKSKSRSHRLMVLHLNETASWLEDKVVFDNRNKLEKQKNVNGGASSGIMGGGPVVELSREKNGSVDYSKVTTLKANDVWPEPINYGSEWAMLVFQKSLSKKEFLFEAIFYPKDSFEDWVKSQL